MKGWELIQAWEGLPSGVISVCKAKGTCNQHKDGLSTSKIPKYGSQNVTVALEMAIIFNCNKNLSRFFFLIVGLSSSWF